MVIFEDAPRYAETGGGQIKLLSGDFDSFPRLQSTHPLHPLPCPRDIRFGRLIPRRIDPLPSILEVEAGPTFEEKMSACLKDLETRSLSLMVRRTAEVGQPRRER